jgi:hypothetical protein
MGHVFPQGFCGGYCAEIAVLEQAGEGMGTRSKVKMEVFRITKLTPEG